MELEIGIGIEIGIEIGRVWWCWGGARRLSGTRGGLLRSGGCLGPVAVAEGGGKPSGGRLGLAAVP